MLHLDWARDPAGYELETIEPLDSTKKPLVSIVRRSAGDVWEPTTPLKIDGLYRQLADCPKTPEGALTFVNRHGFLFSAHGTGEDVDVVIGAIDRVQNMIGCVERRDWKRLATFLELSRIGGGYGVARLSALLEMPAEADRPSLVLSPGDLRSAIELQLLTDATGGAKLKSCANPVCPEWFKYGPGTKHRETAMYCSPKCQKAHAYMKSKEARS